MSKNDKNNDSLIGFILFVLVVGTVVGAVYLYRKYVPCSFVKVSDAPVRCLQEGK